MQNKAGRRGKFGMRRQFLPFADIDVFSKNAI
jgi:hypothetical protein